VHLPKECADDGGATSGQIQQIPPEAVSQGISRKSEITTPFSDPEKVPRITEHG
jgi:hypothetical protein